MSEITGGLPQPGNTLPQTANGEALQRRTLEAVHALDPELLEQADTRPFIEMGAALIKVVTETYGTPDQPRWYTGTVETKPMTYHNGGYDGHTSAGELGAGVPRATLVIAAAVNRAAGREVYDPLARATGFYAASAHDRDQNCGRALLSEGQQGEGFGDERLSAEAAREMLLSAGLGATAAQAAYDAVMATAFDPNTRTQNIRYGALGENPTSPDIQRAILGQELVAAADLLSLTHPRGAVCSVENIVEVLASNAGNRVLQEALQAKGISTDGETDMGQLLDVIGQDAGLRAKFTDLMQGQGGFYNGFQYSDRAIRAATGGRGIDDLFPGRAENAAVLANFAEVLRNGTASPREVWQRARIRAGYTD